MQLFNAALCCSSILLLSFVRLSKTVAACTSQSSTCKCSTSDGDIDLSALDNRLNPLVWNTRTNWQYTYNPCSPLTCGALKDSDVAVCERSSALPYYYYNLGNQKSAAFKYSSVKGLNYVEYADTAFTSQIFLDCDRNENGKFSDGPSGPQGTYSFTLTSKHCCPVQNGGGGGGESGGLSAGSILLIIFFCLLFAYFVGGALFLHFARQETGLNMIPNLEFWKQLPGYIKDGCVFTYDTIMNLVRGSNRSGYTPT